MLESALTAWRDDTMRRLLAVFFAGLIGVAVASFATAEAAPNCPNSNTVILQGEPLPRQGNLICDDDAGGGGLLGNAPVVGNLPGLGGLL
jgi:hypothetical protein